MQQQAGRLDGAGAQEQGAAALLAVHAGLVAIDHRRDLAGQVALDAVHEARRADLGAVNDGLRQVRDVHAGLRPDPAALVAVAAVDAGLADCAVGLGGIAGQQGGRGGGSPDTQCCTSLLHGAGGGVEGGGRHGVAAGRVPGIVRRAGDADGGFNLLDGADKPGVVDRPVAAHAVIAVDTQVARVRTGAEGAPVEGGTPDARAAVVGAEGLGRVAAA